MANIAIEKRYIVHVSPDNLKTEWLWAHLNKVILINDLKSMLNFRKLNYLHLYNIE